MKKLILIFILIGAVYSGTFAQDNFSLNFAQTYSKFKFIDSQGVANESLTSDIRYSYGLNYNKIFENGLFIRPELGYKHLGAISILGSNQKLSWNLHYADLNAGAGYILQKFKFKPYAGASFYFSYLYKADQTIGAAYYNMLDLKAVKKTDFGVNIYAGVQFAFTRAASVFFEIRNSTGLRQLEPNILDSQNQKMYNRAFSFQFGLSFNLDSIEGQTRI